MAIVELVLQSAVLGLLLLGVAQLAVKPPVRRELRTAHGLLAGLLLAAAAATLRLCSGWPPRRRSPAVC
jgi:uncharacterized membrane protein YraQ (UPF0718 family)